VSQGEITSVQSLSFTELIFTQGMNVTGPRSTLFVCHKQNFCTKNSNFRSELWDPSRPEFPLKNFFPWPCSLFFLGKSQFVKLFLTVVIVIPDTVIPSSECLFTVCKQPKTNKVYAEVAGGDWKARSNRITSRRSTLFMQLRRNGIPCFVNRYV